MSAGDDGRRAALIRAVCAEPDDDGVRLILADWLEDHGEPERAAFIRAQLEEAAVFRADPLLAQNPHAYTRHAGLLRLVHRPADAWSPSRRGGGFLWEDWLGSLPHYGVEVEPPHQRGPAWSGGFPRRAAMPFGVLVARAPAVFALLPLRSVTLRDVFVVRQTDHGYGLAVRRGERPPRLLVRELSPRKPWRTREEGEDAVSAACVRYGRRRAGLFGG